MYLVLGKKRSGKSILAEWIFSNVKAQKKAIINPKNDRRLAKLFPNRVTQPPYLFDKGVVNIVVPETITDYRKYDPWIRPLYQVGNIFVFFDEAGNMTTSARYAPSMRSIVQLGADRGVGGLFVSQRVRNIPGFLRSEADHYFVFRLQNASDRKALEEDTAVNWDAAADLDSSKHEFLYYGPGLETPIKMTPLKGVKYADLYNG